MRYVQPLKYVTVDHEKLRVVQVEEYKPDCLRAKDPDHCHYEGDAACLTDGSACGGYMGGTDGVIHCQEPLWEGELDTGETNWTL